jgi:uncharacterized lipoprotein NlpE involved in copper resistance
MKKNVFGIMILLISLISCQNQTSDKSGSEKAGADEKAEVKSETSKGKYAIKSGIVVYKTQVMGMDAIQTTSFDEYGQKEINDIKMEMMGVKIHSANLTKDGYMYALDLTNRTGTKSPANPMYNASIDFQNLTAEMEKDMNLKREGKEDFLGKTCEKMSIDYTQMRMKGTFLVYKGVALKIDVMVGSTKMQLTGESFEENPTIPAEVFDVPADIVIP